MIKLGEENPEYRFIYGDLPEDSDDIISFIQGMSAGDIYKWRWHMEMILQNVRDVYFK